MLCGLGQVAFPLWDSVLCPGGERAMVSSPRGRRGLCSPQQHQQHLLCPLLSSSFREAPHRPVGHSCGIFNFLMEKRWTEKKILSSPEHSTVACHSSAPSPSGPHLPQSLASHSHSGFDAWPPAAGGGVAASAEILLPGRGAPCGPKPRPLLGQACQTHPGR